MHTFLVVIHVLASIFLILVVLLQQGKGAGMGAAFGGSTQTLFGGRGRATPLQKMTAVMAFLFMALSVALASLSTQERSDLADEGQPPPAQEAGMAPAAPPAPVPAAAPAAPAEGKPTEKDERPKTP